jgi:prepilin-type N-terminal cleavage/methylation domain-containing protein
MKRDAGFTLLEVMISMLIGTIGLMGTIAVQQSIISASKNANDAAVAMRLATQKLEELSALNTDTPGADAIVGLGPQVAKGWQPLDSTNASVPEYVDAEGICLRNGANIPIAPAPADLGRYRWHRQWRVVNTGGGLPYVISVIVTYNNDTGDPKTTRLDLERRKSW